MINKSIKKFGYSITFYANFEDLEVVKGFDFIAKNLKESNRSKELLGLMKRYVAKYSESEEEEEIVEEEITAKEAAIPADGQN